MGGTTAAVRARPGGALALGSRVLRPLRFGERWRLLHEVGDGSGVAAAVLARTAVPDPHGSVMDDGVVDPVIEQILALHLAGARPERAVPGFARQLADLVDAGWAPRDVFDADADLIDLIAEACPVDDDWTSIVLAADPPAPQSLPEVLKLLEDDLRHRLTTADSPEAGHHADPVDRTRPMVGNRITEPEGSTHTVQPLPPSPVRHRSAAAHMINVAAAGPRAGSEPSVVNETPPASPATWASSSSPRLIAADADAAPPPGGRSATTPEARTTSEPVPHATAFRAPSPVFGGDDAGGRRWPLFPPATPFRALSPVFHDDDPSGRRRPLSMDDVGDLPFLASNPAGRTFPSVATHGGGTTPGVDPAPITVQADPTASLAWPLPSPAPASAAGDQRSVFDLADQVAALLDEESDLRGLRR